MAVIEHLLAQYGYLTVAVGVGAESIGAPLPGETILIVAASYAGATHHLSPVTVVIVAAVAAIMGDNVGYWLGRRYGARILAAADRRLGARARHLHTVQRLFERYGSVVVVAGRFVSVVRTYAAFGAGTTKMRWLRFLALNALGGVGWAVVIGFGSAALGASAGTSATYVLAALAALGFVSLAVAARIRRKRSAAAADATTAPNGATPSSRPRELAESSAAVHAASAGVRS
jgi:membrane protein DedA with SNARE-associated domain